VWHRALSEQNTLRSMEIKLVKKNLVDYIKTESLH
jgi:hypothetical protein